SVVSSMNGSSSAIMTNANSMAMLWTRASGKSDHQQYALDIQARSNVICMNESFVLSERRYGIRKAFRDRYDEVRSAKHCSIPSAVSNYEPSCEDLVKFAPPSESDDEGAFRCEVLLNECELTCIGPSKDLVFAATRQYVCAVHSSTQSALAILLIAVIVFICVNSARVLILKGLVRLSFAVRMSGGIVAELRPIIWRCNVYTGELARTAPIELDAENAARRRMLRMFFAREDADDRLIGWIFISASACINVAWIAAVGSWF
ncbi:MAG TPA: hypothetical protein VEF04_17470, partial [Blastocatellia bacterium]|nr:hypothetical protein [Blastocatellia bacterium]